MNYFLVIASIEEPGSLFDKLVTLMNYSLEIASIEDPKSLFDKLETPMD